MVNQTRISTTGANIVVILVFYLFISVSGVVTVIIVLLPFFNIKTFVFSRVLVVNKREKSNFNPPTYELYHRKTK